MEATFNRHNRDFNCDFTIEFNVKNPDLSLDESHLELMESEYQYGDLTNSHSADCFEEIMKSNYSFIKDWSFAGRSNGWWVLICKGSESQVRASSLTRIERIVEEYFRSYGKMLITSFEISIQEREEEASSLAAGQVS